jgi:amidase
VAVSKAVSVLTRVPMVHGLARLPVVLALAVLLTGCARSDRGAAAVPTLELEELTIGDAQRAMASGLSTSRQLVARYLKRIDEVDRRGPALRSIIEVNPDALRIADELDAERRQRGTRGPLHGIPIVIKDNIDTADRMTTTAGSLALEGMVAPQDAFIVERLRAAGAVILAKTNLSEWANIRSTQSSSGWSARGGQVRNPYALDRNPCGSSSGSAVAVSANLAAAAVGTETDGSIVCPAGSNGIVGVKPTVGLVSRAGIIPISHTQDTAGPMARTVTDAAIPTVDRIQECELEVLLHEFKTGLNTYLAGLGPGARVRTLTDLIAFNNREKAREMPFFGQELFEQAEKKGPLTSTEYRTHLANCQRWAGPEGIDAVIETHQLDALVAPTGGPAWPIDLVNGDQFVGASSSIAAVAGYPNITVPAGDVFGLPVGISFFGAAWSDATLIRFAYAFEQATHHRRVPGLRASIEREAPRAAHRNSIPPDDFSQEAVLGARRASAGWRSRCWASAYPRSFVTMCWRSRSKHGRSSSSSAFGFALSRTVRGAMVHGRSSTAGSSTVACHTSVFPSRRSRSVTFMSIEWNQPGHPSHVSSLKSTVSTTSASPSQRPRETPFQRPIHCSIGGSGRPSIGMTRVMRSP